MRIGELCRLTGASAKAIRLYESLHLLPPVPRHGAYRHYNEAHRQQVVLIRRAQALGISLAQMRALLPGSDGIDWSAAAALLGERQRALAMQLQRVKQQAAGVATLLDELAACPGPSAVGTDCIDA